MFGWRRYQAGRGGFHKDFSNSAKKFWVRASAEGEACCCKVMTEGPSVACSEIFADEAGSGAVCGGWIGSNLAKADLRRERRAEPMRIRMTKPSPRSGTKRLPEDGGDGRISSAEAGCCLADWGSCSWFIWGHLYTRKQAK